MMAESGAHSLKHLLSDSTEKARGPCSGLTQPVYNPQLRAPHPEGSGRSQADGAPPVPPPTTYPTELHKL